MADIFISYKSERRKAARHLAKVLSCYGFSTWYDYGLIPGDDFEPRLKSEIDQAKAVVVLWCKLAAKSRWVNNEAQHAKAQSKYLPAKIEATELPVEFASADTLDLTAWDGAPRSHALDRLLTDLGRRIGRAPVPDFSALRELDEDWRGFGGLSLQSFALGDPASGRAENMIVKLLGDYPGELRQQWILNDWEAASSGDAEKLSYFAMLYSNGHVFPKDKKEATRLYALAAERGNPRAQYWLGAAYQAGDQGVPKDLNQTVRLWRLAADQSDDSAMYELGRLYERGEPPLVRDEVAAAAFYNKASAKGNVGATFSLAEMYADGRGGLPLDGKTSLRLLQRIADDGNPAGLRVQAEILIKGRGGLPVDTRRARELMEEAAAGGDYIAKLQLGK